MKNLVLGNQNYQKYLLISQIMEDFDNNYVKYYFGPGYSYESSKKTVGEYLEKIKAVYFDNAFIEVLSLAKEKKEFLLERIDGCTERERDILRLLLSEKGLDYISNHYGLTQERTKMIFLKALRRKCFLLAT